MTIKLLAQVYTGHYRLGLLGESGGCKGTVVTCNSQIFKIQLKQLSLTFAHF